jgi:hypothetical protein
MRHKVPNHKVPNYSTKFLIVEVSVRWAILLRSKFDVYAPFLLTIL